MALPDSVTCKLFRAQEHLQELEAEVHRYYETNPAHVERQPEGSPDEFIGKVVANRSIPLRIPLIVGDYLQNLGSTLDYLIWELVLAAENLPGDKNMFPICTTPEAFNTQLARGRLRGLSIDAITEVKALQPYHRGERANETVLAVIDRLSNLNKHRRILTTVLTGAQAPRDFVTEQIGGETWAEVDFASISAHDAKIGPFSIVDGPQGPGLKMDVPAQILAYISLNEGAAQEGEIGLVLSLMGKYVMEKALSKFERFFV